MSENLREFTEGNEVAVANVDLRIALKNQALRGCVEWMERYGPRQLTMDKPKHVAYCDALRIADQALKS